MALSLSEIEARSAMARRSNLRWEDTNSLRSIESQTDQSNLVNLKRLCLNPTLSWAFLVKIILTNNFQPLVVGD